MRTSLPRTPTARVLLLLCKILKQSSGEHDFGGWDLKAEVCLKGSAGL